MRKGLAQSHPLPLSVVEQVGNYSALLTEVTAEGEGGGEGVENQGVN